jgi:hypothetical protein
VDRSWDDDLRRATPRLDGLGLAAQAPGGGRGGNRPPLGGARAYDGPVSVPGFNVHTVAELQARLDAERSRAPFLLFRDGEGRQQILRLGEELEEVAIGRRSDPGIRIDWDPEVSRVHALLQRVGGAWTVLDDGLSRNGTFVNEARVVGRRRLEDGDTVRCGGVMLLFRDPSSDALDETLKAPGEGPPTRGLSPAQRRVLVALCRPLRDPPFAHPATNKQIAAELSLSVDAVKTHLRRIAAVLDVDDLPQNEKRAQLAWQALKSGIVTPRDLVSGS